MKAIKCEMCGSSDFAKEDGMFVCQHCKTKYTVEEAKKIMVEIDDSKKLPNLYERARKSLEVDDLAHAAEYYKEILDINPKDWEAYFYSYLGEFTSYTNAEAPSVLIKLGSTIPPAYDMAIEGCGAEEAALRVRTITLKSVARVLGVVSCGYTLIQQYEGGSIITPAGKVNNDLYNNMRPLVQNIVVAGIDTLEKFAEKIDALGKSGFDADVVKESLLVIRRQMFSIANHDFRPTEMTTEKMIKSSFIAKYAQAIIDLGGFGTCKGEEEVLVQIEKAKAILFQDGKKAGKAKGTLTITNYKFTCGDGSPKKTVEKSLRNLYEIKAMPFYLFLYFTDGQFYRIFDTFSDKNAAILKNKLGL